MGLVEGGWESGEREGGREGSKGKRGKEEKRKRKDSRNSHTDILACMHKDKTKGDKANERE